VFTLTGGPGSHDARSLLGRMVWRLAWRMGWAGPGLSLTLSSACCTPNPLHWHLTLGWQHAELALQDQSSSWPMAWLSGLGAPWNTLQAEGRMQWQSTGLRLRWQDGQLHWHGHSELQLHDIASRLSTLRPMGSYRLTLHAAPGTTTPPLALETLTGPLRLSGQGHWQQQRLRFAGELRATGDVLIDQLVQMQRTGFDVAVLAEGVDASAAQRQLDRYAGFYQGSAVETQPHFAHTA